MADRPLRPLLLTLNLFTENCWRSFGSPRPSRKIAMVVIRELSDPVVRAGPIVRRDRLGGIPEYERATA